jgi:hypothetical protein
LVTNPPFHTLTALEDGAIAREEPQQQRAGILQALFYFVRLMIGAVATI